MAYSFLQSQGSTGSGATIPASSWTFSATVGSTFIAMFYLVSGTVDISGITDGAGNSWSAVGTIIRGTGSMAGVSVPMWTCTNNGTGSFSITTTLSATCSWGYAYHEYSGGTHQQSSKTSAMQASGLNWTGPTVNYTAGNYSVCNLIAGAAVSTLNSPWTARQTGGAYGSNAAGDNMAVTGGNQNWTAASNTSADWLIQWTAEFGAAGAAAVSRPKQRRIGFAATSRVSQRFDKIGRRWVKDRQGLLVPEYV